LPQNPSPAGTQTSTAPSPDRRSGWIGVLKTLILVATLIWVGDMMADAIGDIRKGELSLSVRPAWLIASAAATLGGYIILIWSWLYIIAGLGDRTIPFLVGARIWFISNLSVNIPGRIWGILQMGVMSAEQGINPIVAGGASILNAAVNIACGLAVGAIAGTGLLAARLGDRAWIAWVLAGAAVVGICLIPVLLPYVFGAARRFRPSLPEIRAPARVLFVSAAANLIAWGLYGAAFYCLCHGLVDGIGGTLLQHTAAFATSYVFGYLMFLSPAGLGFREKALTEVLIAGGLASAAQANAVSVVSRLWLLIIQIVPALIFLAYHRRPRDEERPAG
jgi:hypothetical protein